MEQAPAFSTETSSVCVPMTPLSTKNCAPFLEWFGVPVHQKVLTSFLFFCVQSPRENNLLCGQGWPINRYGSTIQIASYYQG